MLIISGATIPIILWYSPVNGEYALQYTLSFNPNRPEGYIVQVVVVGHQSDVLAARGNSNHSLRNQLVHLLKYLTYHPKKSVEPQ